MVALGTWGLANRSGTTEQRTLAEVLRDGSPDLVRRLMAELREDHLGIPRPHLEQPRAGQLHRAYAAVAKHRATA
jgi:hypothetical protein